MVILFDQYHLPDSIFDIVFATEQQSIVARLLVEQIKDKGGELTKTEMSLFATKLHEGKISYTISKSASYGEIKIPVKKRATISYNKRQFYDRILTPMRSMGLIDYDMYKKTYKLSDRFNKMCIKIGLMWLRELRQKGKDDL